MKVVNLVRELIDSRDFLERHRTDPKHFTRQGKMPFGVVICFIINALKGKVQAELDSFFKALLRKDVDLRYVSAAAFCKARRKIAPAAFIEISNRLTRLFYDHAPERTLEGKRLIAIDGSTFVLPSSSEVRSEYGTVVSNSRAPRCLGRSSVAYDVYNDLVLDARLASYNGNHELPMAFQQVDRLYKNGLLDNAIILGDRGYSSFAFLCLLRHFNAEFLVRLKLTHPLVVKLAASGDDEITAEWRPKKVGRKSLPSHLTGISLKPITLRVVKVENAEGETMYLASNLEDSKLSIFDLDQLYHLRWGVEEQYKVMKCRLEIENFSGTTLQCIQQDFHAKILFFNLVAVLTHEENFALSEDNSRHHQYKLNRTETLSKAKFALVLMFLRDSFVQILKDLGTIWKKCLTPIRPGRSFPRAGANRTGLKVQGHYPPYKRAA